MRRSGFGESLKRARRWHHLTAFQSGNHCLRRPHRFGNLFLRQIRLAPRLDHGRCKGELPLKRIIRGDVLRVFLPPRKGFFNGNEFACH
jgi:hypothetical protein